MPISILLSRLMPGGMPCHLSLTGSDRPGGFSAYPSACLLCHSAAALDLRRPYSHFVPTIWRAVREVHQRENSLWTELARIGRVWTRLALWTHADAAGKLQ